MRTLLAALLVASSASLAQAQSPTPATWHLQARLSDAAGAPLTAPISLTARVYDVAIGGSPLWTETQSVTPLSGVVNVELGVVSAIPNLLLSGTPRYLALQVNADAEMLPRRPIVSVPYARRAASAASVEPGASLASNLVGSAQIVDGTVSAADLAPSSVTAGSIANGAVTTAALAADAVTGSRIQDGAVGTADLADGAVTQAKIAGTAITGAAITDGTIGTVDLADGAVTAAKLAGASVGSAALQASSVTAVHLTSNSVNASALATNSVGADEIAANAVGSSEIANDAVGSSEIASDAVGVNEIANPLATSSVAAAIRIEKSGSSGDAFQSLITASTGSNSAVHGETSSSSGTGVSGEHTATSGSGFGVLGSSDSSSGYGVYGSTGAGPYAVFGINSATSGFRRAVAGNASATSGTNYGVYGSTSSATGYGVYSSGDLGASGVKAFLQPHPTDPSREIRFVALEGNEAGTYFRGTAQLAGGAAVIEVPEAFRLATETEGLTVQLTSSGGPALLWTEEESLQRIVVRGSADVRVHYTVHGVRRGYAAIETIRPNHAFVPQHRGVPWGTQHPDAIRRILVENGTLNPDFTPNEETASRMGWVLVDPATDPARPEYRKE